MRNNHRCSRASWRRGYDGGYLYLNWLAGMGLAVWMLIWFTTELYSQSAPGSSQVTVTINNIAIDGELSLRGLTAEFPHPVLSSISVVDAQGNPVLGLADTSAWLGPGDLAQIGLPVSQIWKTVLEYHRDEPSVPADPNIYNSLPPPLFTEVRETLRLPTSTMLIMDVSSSMQEEIGDAKAGAQLFVDLMRPVDRAGIMQFANVVRAYQPMTSNKDSLTAFINATTLGNGTALMDALLLGVERTRDATGRRGIIVYTDGRDNRSVVSPDTIIARAQMYGIPIFTIALGNETREERLKQIADQTGGLFFKVATAQEMIAIYGKLSDLIQNYYLMAHTSTDPVRNNTWRVVDVTIDAANFQGQGSGQYFVAAPPAPPATDLAIELTSVTDSLQVEDGDTLSFAQEGEIYQYRIRLRNLGPSKSDTVKIVQFLPDSVRFLSSVPEAIFADDDILNWNLTDVAAGTDTTIAVSVQVASMLPVELRTLPSLVNFTANNDTLIENNGDVDTVYVITTLPPPPPPKGYDLQIVQTVETDTTIVRNGNSVPAVVAGDTLRYVLALRNLGPADATHVTLYDALPESVTVHDFSVEPTTSSSTSFFWQFDTVRVGEQVNIMIHATTAASFPTYPYPLLNISEVIAPLDTNAANDSAATVVYAVSPPVPPGYVDLAITQRVETDSFAVAGPDTIWFARAGETYTYRLTVTNIGTDTSTATVVENFLPDSVTATNIQPEAADAEPHFLRWDLGQFLPATSITLSFDATVASKMPVGENLLINRATVGAENEEDSLLTNNTATATVRNRVGIPGLGQPPLIEARPPLVEVGDSVSVRVQVRTEIASWDLWVIQADGVTDSSYADSFIGGNALSPGGWLTVRPRFGNTRLFTDAEQEQLIFELRTKDTFGRVQTARAAVTVQSSNGLVLERNVFQASSENTLAIRFRLSSNRDARLDLFDIAGVHISLLADGAFSAGWNTLPWDGTSDRGEKIGSGVYMVTLRSGGFNAIKKVMVVR